VTWTDRIGYLLAGSPARPLPAEELPEHEPSVERAELEAQRRRLARQFAEEQWDLGGLAYEMAIRDHFRVDVLTRKAARVQELDAELAAVERLLKLDDEGAAGTCPECGAFYARGAAFCWQCGDELIEAAKVP
jgi:hypothetical protein